VQLLLDWRQRCGLRNAVLDEADLERGAHEATVGTQRAASSALAAFRQLFLDSTSTLARLARDGDPDR
jgi:hypothetical protein